MSSTFTMRLASTWINNTSDFEHRLESQSTLKTNIINFEHGIEDPNGVSRIVALVLNGLFIATGTVGNVHALIIYARRYKQRAAVDKEPKKKDNPYVVFALSLAVLDLITCAFTLALDTVNQSKQFTVLPEGLCKTFRSLQLYVHSNSILHMVLISIHCWRKFCFPFKKQIDGSLARKLCLSCYLIAILPSVPAAILTGKVTNTINGVSGYECLVSDAYDGTIWIKLSMGLMVSLFAICFAIICISYVALIRRLWQVRHQSKTAKRKVGKTTATLIILTVIFILSYLPFMVLSLIIAFNEEYKNQNVETAVADKVLSRFPNLNNILNPFIYVCRDTEFRKTLLKMYARLLQICPFSKKSQECLMKA